MDHRRCDIEPAELNAVKAGYNSHLLRVRVFVAADTNLVSEDGYAVAVVVADAWRAELKAAEDFTET